MDISLAIIVGILVAVIGTLVTHVVSDHLAPSPVRCTCGGCGCGGAHRGGCPLLGHKTAIWTQPYFWPMVGTLFVSGFAASLVAPAAASVTMSIP